MAVLFIGGAFVVARRAEQRKHEAKLALFQRRIDAAREREQKHS